MKKFRRIIAIAMASLLSGVLTITGSIAPALAMPNPSPAGVYWGLPNATIGSSPTRDTVYWNHPSNSGIVQAYGTAAYQDTPNALISGATIAGAGKTGSTVSYLLRQTNGNLYLVNAKNPGTVTQISATMTDPNWQIAAFSDLNKNGDADIIWRNISTGQNAVWFLNASGGVVSTAALPTLTDTNWDLRGVGDFNGDGNLDLLWYHKTNGQVVTWHLDSSYAATGSQQVITTLPNASWSIRPDAAADFDGDGDADILVHLPSSNIAYILKMQGGAVQSSYQLLGQSNLNSSNNPLVNSYRDYAPLFLVEAPVNTLDTTSTGGHNIFALADLGTLTPTTQRTVPSQNFYGAGTVASLDARYKFTAQSTSQLAIGVDNPNLQVKWTDQWGQLTGVEAPPGGFRTDTYGAGTTYYLRVVKAPNAPASTGAINYNLIITPASATPTIASDITPGTESANISDGVRMGTSTYFLTTDGENAGLWKTDGTTAGTVLVKAGANGSGLIANGSTLYFAFEGDDKGVELWKSDGTTAGTVRVADINTQNSGQDGSNPSELIVFNGKVYFAANNGVSGNEVWQSDGTAAGTTIAANINTQTVNSIQQGSDPSGFIVYNGHLVFSANDGVNGREVWRLSTANTPTIVLNQPGSANPQEFAVAGSELYYSAATGGQDANGVDQDVELIRVATNWTGTKLDIANNTASSTPADLFVWGTDVYFAATGANGRELFRANATTVTEIANIYTGTTGTTQNSASPSGFAVINGRLVFAATDSANGRELWAYPGSGSPVRISQIAAGSASSNPIGMKAIQGAIWFAASAGSDNYELYRTTDGINVSLVKELNTGNSNLDPSVPYGFVDGGTGKVIFSAFTNTAGFEPWISDGSSAGTFQLKDTNTLPREGIGAGVTLNGWTYFAATDQNAGRELYRTNGTTTQLVSDIVPGVGSSNPSDLTVAGSYVYFSATTEANGTKLWRTDGTTTAIVANVNASNVSDNIGNIVATSAGNVFATATNSDGSLSLRWFNGASLIEVKNFGQNGFVAEMKALGNAVYLSASDRSGSSDLGLEPWRATNTNATLLGDLNPGTGKSSNPYEFVQTANGDVYFAANNDSTGYELYRSAGGTGTPAQFIQTGGGGLAVGANGSNLTSLTAIDNRVYFAAYTSRNRSCGSLGFQSLGSSTFSSCQAWSDAGAGNEKLRIWVTDGSENGTYQDPTLTSNGFYPNSIAGSSKPDLEYLSYLDLMAVKTTSGSAVYSPGSYGKLTERSKPGFSSTNFPGESCIYGVNELGVEGRQIGVSVLPANFGIHKDAFVPTPVFGTISNQTSINNGDPVLPGAAGVISVTPGSTCMFAGTNSGGNPQLAPWTGSTYDARLTGHEDVVLGNVNGTIYIAGWKADRYEIWNMPHAETFTTRYLPNGEVAPRNLTFVGSFSNIDRGTLEFQPSGTQMLMKGYDKVAAKQRVWKL